mmetsp:Transcript_2312/g.3229  ORF Transcript_2312/g.3229 Transcript_2312/m.3229 type:complete len:103 (-) Transcript_2312:692-1000(-)
MKNADVPQFSTDCQELKVVQPNASSNSRSSAELRNKLGSNGVSFLPPTLVSRMSSSKFWLKVSCVLREFKFFRKKNFFLVTGSMSGYTTFQKALKRKGAFII